MTETSIRQDYHNNTNPKTPIISPYSRFIYALNAPESKRQYPTRFQVFLDFLKLDGLTIEEKANHFYDLIIANDGREWLESQLIGFFTLQNSRAEKGEIAAGTIKNYYKPVKLFCEMNNVLINWKFISRGIKKSSEIAEDRPPSVEEIKKLMEYPDRRMRPIVLTMISSGIRVGSWDYLKWKHIIPLKNENNNIVAAKMIVFDTKNNKEYFSFITPEAYFSLQEWMDFRASHGETITGESWLMRNLWKIRSHKYANFVGSAKHPIKFMSSGIRSMINDSWRIQGIREQLENGKRRHEFKSLHGFRKFFETECQKVMKSLYVSILMSHDTGITAHYHRPKMEELLHDYLLAIDLLTISNTDKLSKENNQLKEQNKDKDYMIKGQLQDLTEQNQFLTSKLIEYEEAYNEGRIISKENAKRTDELAKRFDELIANLDKKMDKEKLQNFGIYHDEKDNKISIKRIKQQRQEK